MEENKQQYHTDTKKPESKHPEPTEEVQLTIETVTPDTHQSLPKVPVANEKTKEKVERTNDSKEEQDGMEEVKVKSKETEEDAPQGKNEQEEDTDNAENIAGEKSSGNNEEDDERDKIETIAP